MYERIIVASDLTPPATAVTVASALGAVTHSLELVTVSPSRAFSDVDRIDLERIAARHGWPPAACSVLLGHDVGRTILRHVERRRRALLVIGSTGPRAWTSPAGGRVSRSILAATSRPVLVVGPGLDVDFHPRPSKLVVAVDDPEPDPATIETVTRWVRTFGCGRTWLVHAGDEAERTAFPFQQWLQALRGASLDVAHEVVHAGDPASGLAMFVSGVINPVVVTTSRHYTDGHRHLTSTTRDLIRDGSCPVLVVPGRRSASTAAAGGRDSDHALASTSPP